jgi:hypothetical protein
LLTQNNYKEYVDDFPTWKYIISYLRNEKGYVRIIAPLYNTNETFDIKVPCIKNE